MFNKIINANTHTIFVWGRFLSGEELGLKAPSPAHSASSHLLKLLDSLHEDIDFITPTPTIKKEVLGTASRIHIWQGIPCI